MAFFTFGATTEEGILCTQVCVAVGLVAIIVASALAVVNSTITKSGDNRYNKLNNF